MDPLPVDRINYRNTKAPDALGRLPHDGKGAVSATKASATGDRKPTGAALQPPPTCR
jgi:hypothetical protein